MQRLNLVASLPHYEAHLRPIWEQMPESMKGDTILGEDRRGRAQNSADVTNLVAGYADVQRTPISKFVFVEHGAGQSYGDIPGNGAYSGGRGYNNAIGFICPNTEVARRWTARYPDKPTAVVGSPRLDPWHAGLRGKPQDDTLAITFHWDAQFTGVQETTSLFGRYADHLFELIHGWKRQGWRVLGHWHPRAHAVKHHWEFLNKQVGVEVVQSVDEVLDRASLLIADNTSLQAEFLSLGRKVVWLSDHEVYRPDVEHGGRFWQWPKLGGLSVDSAASLARLDLSTVPAAHDHPYAYADGLAAKRASLAIQYWLRTLPAT